MGKFRFAIINTAPCGKKKKYNNCLVLFKIIFLAMVIGCCHLLGFLKTDFLVGAKYRLPWGMLSEGRQGWVEEEANLQSHCLSPSMGSLGAGKTLASVLIEAEGPELCIPRPVIGCGCWRNDNVTEAKDNFQ